jgi:hypothetical protein
MITQRLPRVLIVNNSLSGWPYFRRDMDGHAEIVVANSVNMYDVASQAFKEWPPDVIGIGCISNGRPLTPGNIYAEFIEKLRSEDDFGYTGPILGLCRAPGCVEDHLNAGCDEVVSFAGRIIELLEAETT